MLLPLLMNLGMFGGGGPTPTPTPTPTVVGGHAHRHRPKKRIFVEYEGRNYFFNSHADAELFLAARAAEAKAALNKAAALIARTTDTGPRHVSEAKVQRAQIAAQAKVAAVARMQVSDSPQFKAELARIISDLDQMMADALHRVSRDDLEEAELMDLFKNVF